MMSLWPSIHSNCNFIKHASGWLEEVLCASFKKLIVDEELLQMMSSFPEKISFSNEEMALDAIADIGAGPFLRNTTNTGSVQKSFLCLIAFRLE